MAVFTEPYFFSDCLAMDMEVEQAIKTISNTQDTHVREKLLLELHQHLLDYPCPALRRALQQLNSMLGHKPFSKLPTADIPKGITPPAILTNKIFQEDNDRGDKIDMGRLWNWIYDNLVVHLEAKYEWLALLIFAEGHGLLKEDATKAFCRQMEDWYGREYTKQTCSYDQVTTYQTGYFRNPSFKYREWITGDGSLPPKWTPNNKNQKEEGYKRIHQLCKAMEADFLFGKVIETDKQ